MRISIVSLSLVEYSNTRPVVPLNATLSLWITFTLTPEPHNSPTIEWCSVVTQLCYSSEWSVVSNTYTANLTKTISRSDYGSHRVLVCGVKLSLDFEIDYSGAGKAQNSNKLLIAGVIIVI